MSNFQGYSFYLYNIRDYNTVISLIKEHNLPLISVKTGTETSTNKTVVKVITQGDKNTIEFINYLLKKEQEKANKILKKIKVKEIEIGG